MLTPGRHASDESYRYGFQGQEKDDELKGEGNSYGYTNRFYDARVGRWLSLDAVDKEYQGNYNYSANNPIIFIDKGGDDDYYYDALTHTLRIIRNGAPHRFFFTDYIFADHEGTGVLVGQSVTEMHPINSRRLQEFFYVNNDVFRRAFKSAKKEQRKLLWDNIINPKGEKAMMAVGVMIGSAGVIVAGLEIIAYFGAETTGTFLLNEAKDELLSQATGGASDWLDLSKSIKNAGEKLLKKKTDDAHKLFGGVDPDFNAPKDLGNVFGKAAKEMTSRNLSSNKLKELIPTEAGAQSDIYVNAMKETIRKNDPWEMMDLMAEPIHVVTTNGKTYILNGHNRIKAFSELNKSLDVIELSPSKAKEMYKSTMQDIGNGLHK